MKKIVILSSVLLFAIFNCQSAAAQTISTIADTGTNGFTGDGGPATDADCGWVARVAVDTAGNVYFGDFSNNRIRRIDGITGTITTIAGTGTAGFSGDGMAATLAEINKPQGLAVDIYGNLYIADVYNNRIRKIDTSGIITTIAGTGTGGALGDSGLATNASIIQAMGVAVDRNGNVYIADRLHQRIRMVDTAGYIYTIAGNDSVGFLGDGGPAILAELNYPIDVALDTLGNIYISDQGNSRIRVINPGSNISTIAGNSDTSGFAGDGGPATNARFNSLEGIAVDAFENVYVVDGENSRVRKISPSHFISTFAGNGLAGYGGDGGPATDATLSVPNGVAVDKMGNVYIGDNENNRVRKVTPLPTVIKTVIGAIPEFIVSPNPINRNDQLKINIKTLVSEPIEINIVNTLGIRIKTIRAATNEDLIVIPDFAPGNYFLDIVTRLGKLYKQIVILGKE